MARAIADYALIGNCETVALVARNGSIDWLCSPRFDSPACFAALLGTSANGYWRLSPIGRSSVTRRYRPHTLILETTFKTNEGQVTLIDFMPPEDNGSRIIRVVRGDSGTVRMRMELLFRFNYGKTVPSIKRHGSDIVVTAGSDHLTFRAPGGLKLQDDASVGLFNIRAGATVAFELELFESSRNSKSRRPAKSALQTTEIWWRRWASHLKYRGPGRDAVERSLITLKALTYAPTGGIIAAPTTSLPEIPSGRRNWDYRYCWLRDATFTLLGFIHAGYHREAQAWKNWLLHAVGARPDRLRVMYDVMGKLIRHEQKLRWLPGFQGAAPVKIGNAARKQVQLDVFGELTDVLYQAGTLKRKKQAVLRLLISLLDHLEGIWQRPDHGIWEVRGKTRHFTHSKVMCWVAFDRAIRNVEEMKIRAPLEKWRSLRREIHESVCRRSFNTRLGAFVQAYGSQKVDASLLLLPLVGFLPPEDPRIVGTVRLIEKRLLRNGFAMRREKRDRGSHEGAFLPCSFWLADYYELTKRRAAARGLLKRLLKVRNDVGLLSEEYDPARRRLIGNFPQALSHVALINTIINLYTKRGPSRQRSFPNPSAL
jgi:GH15 family glucan-1,4-alpha-glucosidase